MPGKVKKKSESPRRQSPKQSTAGKPSSTRETQSNTYESKPKKGGATRAQAGISRSPGSGTKSAKGGAVRRAATKVVAAVSRVVRRGKTAAKPAGVSATKTAPAARVPKRQPDIPLDQIANTYTPMQTSLKGPLRASGDDRLRDQEFANGAGDDRWNDEDRLTNKSGDPRIGTHGRTYEPAEAKTARKRDDEDND